MRLPAMPTTWEMRKALFWLWGGFLGGSFGIVVVIRFNILDFLLPLIFWILLCTAEAWWLYSISVTTVFEDAPVATPEPVEQAAPVKPEPVVTQEDIVWRNKMYNFIVAAWNAPQIGEGTMKGFGFSAEEYTRFRDLLIGVKALTKPERGASPQKLLMLESVFTAIQNATRNPEFWSEVGINVSAASPITINGAAIASS